MTDIALPLSDRGAVLSACHRVGESLKDDLIRYPQYNEACEERAAAIRAAISASPAPQSSRP
jgi:hypothetical protein